MVSTTLKARVAILNLDNVCRCQSCMSAIGHAFLNLELLVVITRDATQLPTLVKKAAIIVEAHDSTKVTAMRVVRALNDLALEQDPESDDLIHPDDITPHVSRLMSQQVGHG